MEKSTNDELELQHYLVAFIDVLGQKELLCRYQKLPINEQEKIEFTNIVKDTFGYVLKLREEFDSFLNSIMAETEASKMMPEDIKKLVRAEIKYQGFSDSVIIYTSLLITDDIPSPLKSIYGILMCSALISISAMSENHALRGGVEIGWGAEIKDREIYGNALNNAYHIEQEISQYPRIVAGKKLTEYLRGKSANDNSDFISRANKIFSDRCLSIIKTDLDGYSFVDYLGEGFKMALPLDIQKELLEKIKQARKFVNYQTIKWQKEKNTKLALRYRMLSTYFDSHMKIWE